MLIFYFTEFGQAWPCEMLSKSNDSWAAEQSKDGGGSIVTAGIWLKVCGSVAAMQTYES